MTETPLTPIDTATDKPAKPIGAGLMARGMAITPNGATAYVANWGTTTVTPITTATNKAAKPIQVGNGPIAIAMTRG